MLKLHRTKEDSSLAPIHNSLTTIRNNLTTAIRSLTATTTRTATSSLLRTQECDLHAKSSQGTFACAEARASRYDLQSPYGNLAVKRSDFYTDFSRNPFVLQNRDRVFAIPKVSRATRRLADHVRLYKQNSIHPFNQLSLI